MALAINFLAIVDEWASNLLDFARIEVRVLTRHFRSLERKYAPWQRRKKLDLLPEVNSFPQV